MAATCSACRVDISFGRRLLGAHLCKACEETATAEARRRKEEADSEARDALLGYEAILRRLDLASDPRPVLEDAADFVKHSNIDEAWRQHIAQGFFDALIDEMTQDDLWTLEENDLSAILADGLGAVRGAEHWERVLVCSANSGILPRDERPAILLNRGEAALYGVDVALLSERVVKEFRSTFSSASFPLGGGVRYRAGQSRGRTVVIGTKIEVADQGTLTVTDRRVVFSGARRTMDFPHARLVGISLLEDGIALQVANRQSVPTFRTGIHTNEAFAAILNTAASRARGTFVAPDGILVRRINRRGAPITDDHAETNDRGQRTSQTEPSPPEPSSSSAATSLAPSDEGEAARAVFLMEELSKFPGLPAEIAQLKMLASTGHAGVEQLETAVHACAEQARRFDLPPALTPRLRNTEGNEARKVVCTPSEDTVAYLDELRRAHVLTPSQVEGLKQDVQRGDITETKLRLLGEVFSRSHGRTPADVSGQGAATEVPQTASSPAASENGAHLLRRFVDEQPRTVPDALASIDTAWGPSTRRTAISRTLIEVYREAGVLPDELTVPALKDICPDSAACWKSDLKQPSHDLARTVSFPYIGDQYGDHRIVLMGLNTNQSGGLIVLWKTIAEALANAADGQRRTESRFARRIAEPVQRLASRDGAPIGASEALRRVAFIQAVKCGIEDGKRGTPPTSMCRRCPPRFLTREMDVLRPAIVLVFGWRAAPSIRKALGATDWTWVEAARLEHGEFAHAGGVAKLVNLSHPSGNTWGRSLELFSDFLGT